MHLHHQHIFVIRAIENTDVAPFWQSPHGAPQIIVVQFFGAGLLKVLYRNPLGIHTGNYMLDRTIFASRVHGLDHDQHSFFVFCIKPVLQLGHSFLIGSQQCFCVFPCGKFSGIICVKVPQMKFVLTIVAIISDIHKANLQILF